MGLTAHQRAAMDAGNAALKRDKFAFVLGYAGVGKTFSEKTLIEEKQAEGIEVVGTAPTWAAAIQSTKSSGLFFISNHKLLYSSPDEDKNGRLRFGEPIPDNIPYGGLVVADEAGMIGTKVGRDLKAMCEVKNASLWLYGDNFQLGPVNDERYFSTDRATFTLTEVVRQNPGPGLNMLTEMRNKKCRGYFGMRKFADQKELIDCGWRKDSHIKRFTEKFIASGDGQIICYYNKTRREINKQARTYLGFSEKSLNYNERVVFLTNTDPVVNSDIGIVKDIEFGLEPGEWSLIQRISPLDMRFCRVTLEDGRDVVVSLTCLDQGPEFVKLLNGKINHMRNQGYKMKLKKAMRSFAQFDYAYAVTGHKAQGSQFKKVFAIIEHTDVNWQYTVGSRFEEQLMIAKG